MIPKNNFTLKSLITHLNLTKEKKLLWKDTLTMNITEQFIELDFEAKYYINYCIYDL